MRFLPDWLIATVGEHTTPLIIKLVAILTWSIGTLGGGAWLFAQAATPAEFGNAALTMIATSGPAGALVCFLVWWIRDSRVAEKDKEERNRIAEKDKEERFSKILDTVSQRYVDDMREIRKEQNAREDVMTRVVQENTRVNSRIEAKLPLIFPVIDKPSGT